MPPVCKFCSRLAKSSNSNTQHEIRCTANPDKIKVADNISNHNSAISKGEILSHMLGRTLSNTAKAKISKSNSLRSPEWNRVNGEKISKTVNARVEEGTWHTSLARHMHKTYKGSDLHGSWELAYAQYLDSKQIKWERNRNRFIYFYEGVRRSYTPDFYLPETNTYVEIKGYETSKDRAKWEQFPNNESLLILKKSHLKELGLLL